MYRINGEVVTYDTAARRAAVDTISPFSREIIPAKGAEKAVWQLDAAQPMTADDKHRVRQYAVWKWMSFPNGSSYASETLIPGEYPEAVVDRDGYGGWNVYLRAEDKFVHVSGNQRGVGGGADFDEHFCSQDQRLADLAD